MMVVWLWLGCMLSLLAGLVLGYWIGWRERGRQA
jgi:uncharacterized protein YneF (UPF0154 family)